MLSFKERAKKLLKQRTVAKESRSSTNRSETVTRKSARNRGKINPILVYNSKYADRTEKKNYSDHVAKGRRLGKTIEMAVPFGEDRDGDGVIDKRGGSRRR